MIKSHADRGELHGITIVVNTAGPKVYIGRCFEATDERVVLLDADVHEDGTNGRSKEQFIEQAARVGVWNRLKQVTIPRDEVASIQKLVEIVVE